MGLCVGFGGWVLLACLLALLGFGRGRARAWNAMERCGVLVEVGREACGVGNFGNFGIGVDCLMIYPHWFFFVCVDIWTWAL